MVWSHAQVLSDLTLKCPQFGVGQFSVSLGPAAVGLLPVLSRASPIGTHRLLIDIKPPCHRRDWVSLFQRRNDLSLQVHTVNTHRERRQRKGLPNLALVAWFLP